MSNAHNHLLKLHVLHEVEALSGLSDGAPKLTVLPGRLDVLGSYTDDKLYILGVRRAVMEASRLDFKSEISDSWLITSRLRRKTNQLNPAYGAMIRATELGDPGAVVEHARLLWAGGYHRKAIQTLRGAIADESAAKKTETLTDSIGTGKKPVEGHKLLLARTQLLFAKWMDRGGQEKSDKILEYYKASDARSDRSFYHLASYYNKILDSETHAPSPLQSENYLSGECTKLTIENYLRSAFFGTKYVYRSVPKILTLWLDLGQQVHDEQTRFSKSRGRMAEAQMKMLDGKVRNLALINSHIKKYLIKRIPLYITYTALAQMLSRIDNQHTEVANLLRQLVVDITSHYPRQALWSVLSVSRSTSDQKSLKGREILKAVKVRLLISFLR
jgi:serine/threonine-protein kinase ATR